MGLRRALPLRQASAARLTAISVSVTARYRGPRQGRRTHRMAGEWASLSPLPLGHRAAASSLHHHPAAGAGSRRQHHRRSARLQRQQPALASLPARNYRQVHGPCRPGESETAHPGHRHQRLRDGSGMGAALRIGSSGIWYRSAPPWKDATAIASSMQMAAAEPLWRWRCALLRGAGQGGHPRPALERIKDDKVCRRDPIRAILFILFAAGHGTSEDGSFYLIPQDYHRAGRAIWLDMPSVRTARRTGLPTVVRPGAPLSCLDTCESGARLLPGIRARASMHRPRRPPSGGCTRRLDTRAHRCRRRPVRP